jgi:hypothetical protein
MMKMTWTMWIPMVSIAIPLSIGCGSDDSDDGSGGSTSEGEQATGAACVEDPDCFGGLCMTDETFKALTENGAVAEIPGGYCSMLSCTKNQAEGKCGPEAFCFDLEQFVDTPLTACFHECQDDSDCRQDEGYVCTDASDTQWTPLPRKGCMPSSLLCLLDVPQPSCPNVGDAGVDGSAGAAGSDGG